MSISKNFFISLVLLIVSTELLSQDTLVKFKTHSSFYRDSLKAAHLDSLRADSVRKDFIMSHRPVTIDQLNLFKKPIKKSVYGTAVTSFINESIYLKAKPEGSSRFLTVKFRPAVEWLFYSYIFLFLFLASILSISPAYIKVIIGLLFKKGSNQDKSREIKLNTSLPSLMMNVLFIFSSSFFIYFSLSKIYGYNRLNSIAFILSCMLVITFFYLFKFMFLQLCGWLFKQKNIFDHYFSYLSLVNKALGLILLVSSALMAFGQVEDGFSRVVFTLSIVFLVGLLLVRIVNAYFIFRQPFKIGLPEFIIGFLSLEMLPTLVFLKFLQENSVVLLNGFL
jgi:hypothetical protein